MLTRDEIADRLYVSASTVKVWGRYGLLPRHVCNDKGECLYEPPGPHAPIKMRATSVRKPSTSRFTRSSQPAKMASNTWTIEAGMPASELCHERPASVNARRTSGGTGTGP